jgi:hypothetical protein
MWNMVRLSNHGVSAHEGWFGEAHHVPPVWHSYSKNELINKIY